MRQNFGNYSLFWIKFEYDYGAFQIEILGNNGHMIVGIYRISARIETLSKIGLSQFLTGILMLFLDLF